MSYDNLKLWITNSLNGNFNFLEPFRAVHHPEKFRVLKGWKHKASLNMALNRAFVYT